MGDAVSSQQPFRLGDLLEGPARCSFLSEDETIGLVDGRLAAPRLVAFERHVVACPACGELADDLQLFRDLTTSGVTIPAEIRAFERTNDSMLEKLNRISLRRRLRDLFYWLSPILVTVLLAVFLWPQSRLIAEIEPVELVPPPAVRSLDVSQAWQRIADAWESGDLASAADRLEAAVADDPQSADLLFYLGQARLLLGEPAAAVEMLERADAIQQPAISEHTRWMLAAALERTGRRDEACSALRSVVEVDATRAGAAREIVARRCGDGGVDQSAP